MSNILKKIIFVLYIYKSLTKTSMIISIKKRYIFIGILSIILIGISYLITYNQKKHKSLSYSDCNPSRFANSPISPSSVLNDKNDIHLIHAIKNGLKKPFATKDEFYKRKDEMVRKSILVEVNDNCFYQLKSLSHSEPYLIPEAIDLLNEIGYRFQNRLLEKKYKNYRFRITSLLRTEEGQNSLSHRNGNAAGHSSHLYGTTVDISYKNFYNIATDSIESSYEAVQTLTNILVEMRKECKLLAVRERHQCCFHISVVLCRPID